MKQIQNIAITFLLTGILILAGAMALYAQNTGTTPYLDSKHAYKVNIGKAGNDRDWVVTDKNAFSETFAKGTTGHPWFEITAATDDNTDEVVQITFLQTEFDPAYPGTSILPRTLYLQYFEYDADHACISAREFEITLVDNTFSIDLAANFPQCNDESGSIHTKEEIDDLSDKFETEVTYTLTMHKDADYDPDYWSFDFEFSEDVVETPTFDINPANGTIRDGSLVEITPNRKYSIIVDQADTDPDDVAVAVNVVFNNAVIVEVTPSITISNGLGVIAGTAPVPNALTIDNEAIIPIAPLNNSIQIATINPIPLTLDIEPAGTDTDNSAQFPVAGSTHNYKVQLASFMANRSEGVSGWTLEVENRDLVPGSNFTLVESKTDADSPFSYATVTFNETMSTGEYFLAYTEQNTSGCTTVRRYPITLREPMDISIVAEGDQCSGAAGKPFTDVTPELTGIDYTVTLNNDDYEATWQFNLELQCTQFDGSALTTIDDDISVNKGSKGAATFNTTLGTITIPVVIAKPAVGTVDKDVTVTVNYTGIYATEHTIVATLVAPGTPASFGSYGEIDGDATNNTDTHIIYKMPQAGELAGVE